MNAQGIRFMAKKDAWIDLVQIEILKEDLAGKQQLLDQGLVRRTDVNTIRRAIAEAAPGLESLLKI